MEYVGALIALGAFILGIGIAFFFKHTDKFIQFMLGATLGLTGSLIMIELLPDASRNISENFDGSGKIVLLLGYMLIGVLIMRVCDIFLPDHKLNKTNKKGHYLHIGLMLSIPIMVYNLIVGMKLGITEHPLMMGCGLALCNTLFGIVLTSLLSKTFVSTVKLALAIILIGLASPIGALLYNFLSNFFNVTNSVMVLITTSAMGMIIYAAVAEILVSLLEAKYTYITVLGIILGTCLLFISHLFYI